MILGKQTYKKLCNYVVDDLFYTYCSQLDGALVYIDIEQDHVSLDNGTVLKPCTFLAGGNNFAKR